ncbi:hypothetical protein GCM10010399_41450 [Dactylosporangium fulvum]|uniref:Uncharacterized protein n=1 Tax=Dactylosporangium fulvum TaxID=53359 RepID=A0ABY5VZ99_9ACTN|nr:hypothetical protein [Dactylosporangium fulvum]UWP82339.1 hypothetical protein Dfulv_46040 [Dactylosporangium fulvum]
MTDVESLRAAERRPQAAQLATLEGAFAGEPFAWLHDPSRGWRLIAAHASVA